MENKRDHFEVLLLLARPGAGKSEVIDYLKKTPLEERIKRFRVGELREFDDFPILWTWFEEDAILKELGRERLHTDQEDYFIHKDLWNLLIRRLCLDYKKALRDCPDFHKKGTALFEFARGSEHGGFKTAFSHLEGDVLQRAAVLYINVSWEESLRKNRKRFNPDKPDSILEHGLSDDKLEKLYRETDWEAVSAKDPRHLEIGAFRVPYAVMENEDDVTTGRGPALGARLEETLKKLWETYSEVKN